MELFWYLVIAKETSCSHPFVRHVLIFFYLPFNMFTLLLLALKVFAFYEIKKIFLDSSAVVDTNEINAHNNAVPFLKSSYLQI